ncbi:hypothetical protein FRX31_034305 [Thalictrum thalictroides]|uniref:Uncharacterized protein n=1 Tax=Thalictrum thalictroides TaxID=46969 RepID=A0A7J6UU70_THATH|nr:hypothetical protein FRX31_034305 [Thalictrum thalictroides]
MGYVGDTMEIWVQIKHHDERKASWILTEHSAYLDQYHRMKQEGMFTDARQIRTRTPGKHKLIANKVGKGKKAAAKVVSTGSGTSKKAAAKDVASGSGPSKKAAARDVSSRSAKGKNKTRVVTSG